MKQLLKSPFLALVVVAALAAGTALLAGYVDGSSRSTQTAAEKCDECPKAGTEACCKVSGECEKADACASACPQSTCDAKPAAGCCQEKAQPASCPAASSCGAGGCTLTE